MRNGDRNKGELGRGDQAMESLGTGARRETEGELLAATRALGEVAASFPLATPLSEISSTN